MYLVGSLDDHYEARQCAGWSILEQRRSALSPWMAWSSSTRNQMQGNVPFNSGFSPIFGMGMSLVGL